MKHDLSPRTLPLASRHCRSATMRFVAYLTLGAMWLVAGTALAQNNTLRVNKGFSPSPVAAGSPSQMTITLYNTDTAGPQTNVSVTDDFPTNLSWTGLVSNSCGGTLNAPGNTLVLSGGTVPAATGSGASTCEVVVNVAASSAGNYTNTIASGGATGEVGGNPTANSNPASYTLSVTPSGNQRVTGTKAFTPSTMALGETGSFTIRINNPNTFAISGVALSDDLANGANITSVPAGSGLNPTGITGNTCGGSATISGSVINLAGGSIPAGDFCTVTVGFTATLAATYINRLPAGAITVASVSGIDSNAVIAGSVAVQASAVTMTKAFNVDEATYPTPFGLRLTFHNNTSLPVQNLAVTDVFPDSNSNGVPDLVVSELPGSIIENTCGGTVTAPALATSISLTGGGIPANGSCTIYIRVRGSESVLDFSSINTTGECSGSLVGGNNFTCPVASDFVTLRGRGDGAVVVGLSKIYLSNNVNAGTVVRGRLVLATPELTNIVGYTLIDTFQANTSQGAVSDVLLAPTGGNFTFQNCGAGATAAPLAGGNGFTISNVSINALSGDYAGGTGGAWVNPACVVEFDVVGDVAGTHRNIIPIDQGAARLQSDPAGTIRTVLNRRVETGFTYLSPLSVTKAFSPPVVAHGGLSRLTIRLSNSNDQAPITNLSLTDNLPTAGATVNVLVAPSPNITNTCGGTVTASAGSGTVSLVGGAVLAGSVGGVNGLCELSVDVIVSDGVDGSHDFLNRIAAGTVTGTINGAMVSNNSNADAMVYVRAVGMTVSKAFSPTQIDTASAGSFDLFARGTWLNSYDVQATPAAKYVDQLGKYSAVGNPVKLRSQQGVSWHKGDLRATLTMNYVDDYECASGCFVPNGVGIPVAATSPIKIKSWTTFDLNVDYDLSALGGFFQGSRVNFAAVNFTNRNPPFVDGGTAANDALADPYDPANATVLGRTLVLAFDKRW